MKFHPTTRYRKFHRHFGHMRRAYAAIHERSNKHRPYPLYGCVTPEQIQQYLNNDEVTIFPVSDIHVGMSKERIQEVGKAMGSMMLRAWRGECVHPVSRKPLDN